jgi:tetratricopeptide (TPR) repeat protein/thiol-disulfide isomerase/thioredoxin
VVDDAGWLKIAAHGGLMAWTDRSLMKRSMNSLFVSGYLALATTLLVQPSSVAHPAIFSDLSLSQAKAQAKKEAKLLLVDFTAAWCPPCGEMDKTTWEDPNVVKWIHDNAVAIQVDVDKEQAIARDLKIVAMPSLVVFKDKDAEVDRAIGFQDGEELLKWLNDVNNGVTSMDKLQQELDMVRGKGGSRELEPRYELARAQYQAGRYADAQENFVWVWQNMAKVNSELAGVRLTFLASEICDLLAKYPPARARFSKLRDEAELPHLDEWVTLNHILGEDQLTFSWLDKVKNDPSQSAKLKDVAFALEPLLIKAGRFSDAAIFIHDPLLTLTRKYQFAKEVFHEGDSSNPFPEDAGRIYACLLAAGRDAEAERVAQESLKLQDSMEVKEALIFAAAAAGQLKPSLLVRLDEVNASKTDAAGYNKRGAVYLKLKAFDKALANFSKAIELSPSDPSYYDAREAVYCGLKQFDRALADADHVIKIYPNSGRAYVSRGYIHLKQKNETKALENFEEAIHLNPHDPLSYINESAVYMRLGKYQLAYERADQAIKLDANNAGGFCNRGEASLNLKRYDDALADLSKSIDMGKALCGGENFYYRAMVFDALGKNDLAARDRKTAQELGFAPDPVAEN